MLKKNQRSLRSLLPLIIGSFLVACTGGSQAVTIGARVSQLADCPKSPNCVSSDSTDYERRVEPFLLSGQVPKAWTLLSKLVAELPGAKVITAESDYLHAECRSVVFGFVDDFELYYRSEEKIVAVRSAARFGYYDFGVNRKRVETLRSMLEAEGVVD